MIYSTHQSIRERNNGTYTDGTLTDLKITVRDVVAHLRPFRNLFDDIVVRGISGLAVGAPVALRLNRQLIVVRKEPSHGGGGAVVGRVRSRWLFLDDFHGTGHTERECQRAIDNEVGSRITQDPGAHVERIQVGSLFYSDLHKYSGEFPWDDPLSGGLDL